jgi:hypothetical protein
MSGTGSKSGQVVDHVLGYRISNARASSQVVQVRVQIVNVSITYTGQIFSEVLAFTDPVLSVAYVSQIFAEVLIPSDPRVLVAQYPAPPGSPVVPAAAPQLIGVSYTVFKRPVTNIGSYQAPSGREVRVQYYDATVWQWDLNYQYLPDDQTGRHPGTTDSDFHTLVAFFLETRGGQLPFTFYDPDDNEVTGTRIAVTDGIRNVWIVTREYGGAWKEVEPVGYLSYDEPTAYQLPFGPFPTPPHQPVVKLNGVVISRAEYDIIRNELGKQMIRFHQIPAAGQYLTMDFHFVFFTRFADLIQEFEEFVSRIWAGQKITLESMRSYVRG